jgi:RNA polymerase sporulation-specific sigma factor
MLEIAAALELERLTGAADEDLVVQYQGGDARAAEILLRRYRDFARMKARFYFVAGGDRDDVVQEGMIGLYKAIRDFDVSREGSFRGFADVCITRQVITAVKTARRFKHAPLNSYVSLSTPSSGEDEPQISAPGLAGALATVRDPSDVVVSSEEVQAIHLAFAEVLSEFEAEVLHLYVEGKTYREIAGVVGRSAKAIDNAVQRIRRKVDLHLRGMSEDTESAGSLS